MNVRISAVLLAFGLMSSAAHATLYDLRPYWSMVCYPSNGRPYKVATIEAQGSKLRAIPASPVPIT